MRIIIKGLREPGKWIKYAPIYLKQIKMKFKEYLDNLNKLAEENPDTLEMTVVYAKDDEGNGYQEINYDPTLGNFNHEYHGEFHSEENIKEEPEEYDEDIQINSICVN